MRIAIVGGGLAGLALAWHLLPHTSVTLFDPAQRGASFASTGLLHPFPGKEAKRSPESKLALQEALPLLAAAEEALGRPVASYTGLFRPAITETQRENFQKRAEEDEGAIWQNGGLWIPSGITVYSSLYLQGLTQALLKKGLLWEGRTIDSLDELESFDQIFLAAGAGLFPFAPPLPIYPVKGQALLCRSREEPLPHSLASEGHISLTETPGLYLVGSTYERRFQSAEPEPEKALPLLEKVAAFYPPARHFEALEVRAGVRVASRLGPLPIIHRLSPKVALFTALGSRGLLYHSLFAKRLVKEVLDLEEQPPRGGESSA